MCGVSGDDKGTQDVQDMQELGTTLERGPTIEQGHAQSTVMCRADSDNRLPQCDRFDAPKLLGHWMQHYIIYIINLQRDTEEMAHQPETKLGAIAHTRHTVLAMSACTEVAPCGSRVS
jgi:hypothetical protein